LLCINAEKTSFQSDYEDQDEWVRWIATDNSFRNNLENDLPFIVKSTLRRDVHRFGKATPELLSHVYSTKPMLSAAPGEFLNFSNLKTPPKILSPEQSNEEAPSFKRQKNLKANLRNLRLQNAERLSAKRKRCLVQPPRLPRYDEVYFEGLEWLNSLAGEKISEGGKDVVFSDSIWKSPSRSGDDFSD